MPTLTGTGAINLTTPTNWSPAQIPAPGDDLIIGNATLTIDANFVANTVTFNNASSRIDWASLPRTLTATNGFFLTGNLGASSLAVQSLAAGTLTLVGRWTVTAGTNAFGRIASVSGGTLILTTVGASQSAVLCEVTGNTLFSLINLSAGEIQTTGRLLFSTTNAAYYLCNASGGKWTHSSTGTNSFATSSLASPVRLELSGAASIDFYGDFELTGGTFVGRFNAGHTGLVRFFGAFIALGMTADRCFIMNSGSSQLYFHGLIDSNTQILNGGSGSVFWQDASATIAAGKYLRFNQSITAATNLQIQNFGQLAFLQGVGTVGAPLAIYQRTADALFWAGGGTNFSGRLFPFQTNAPTLPAVQNVAAGTVYGYAGFTQTGTGLILDPAVLASAVDGSVWGKVRPQTPVPGTYGAVSEWAGNVDEQSVADIVFSSLISGPYGGGNWPNGSFGERILVGDTTTRAVKVTGAGHAAADVHEFQPDVIDSDAIATSAVTEIAGGVWSAASSAYSAATGTMGLVMYAISTMLEFVSSVWRWKASSLTQAPSGGGGTGSYAMTITATSSGGVVSGVKFQLVGTSLIATTGTSGVITFNVDPGTYTLRTTPPSNWESVADSSVTVTASSVSVTKTLTAIAQVPSVIQGAPSASLALRPAMDRKNPLLTLASVVDHLLLLEEINPAEPRSVDRATKAAREALNSFTSYSTQGFRYYESRAKIVLPGSVSLGSITVSNGQFTMGNAFTMPSWAPLAHVRIDRASNKVYPILLVNGQTITVDTLENGTYANVYMEQLFFPLPRNFRRRGTLSDGKNNYPIEDMSGGSFQSLQDYYRWIGFSELDRRFSAITMDQRNQGDLMLSIWPPFQDRMELSMFFERYPEAMKHHRVGNSAATIGVTGATATSSHAIFDSSHVGAALVVGINNDQELLKSLSSDSLVQTQRIIRYVSSSTQVILDSPVDSSLSNRAFYISDIVDVQPGVMTEAYKRLAEYELLRQTKGSKADKKLEEFIRQLQMTQSDDARYKASIDPYNTPHVGYQWGTVTGRPS